MYNNTVKPKKLVMVVNDKCGAVVVIYKDDITEWRKAGWKLLTKRGYWRWQC